MKRPLSLPVLRSLGGVGLLLFPFALNATPYPEGMLLRASLVLQGAAKHIAQVRIEDDGTNWQLTEYNPHNYSSDLYAIALAVKNVTQEKGLDEKMYPCLHIETVIAPKNDATQKDVKITPFRFGFFDGTKHINLELKDDAGEKIRLILTSQTYFTAKTNN